MKLRKLYESQYTLHAACDDRGNAQLLDFLEGLGSNLRSNRDGILNLLDRCAKHGPPRNKDLKHHLGDGIFELIKGRLRVLYFTDKGKLIICSHGLIKKSGNIPRRDIEAAKRIRERYEQARATNQLQILEED